MQNKFETIWGITLLDDGFTNVPNLLIRNYRRLGIEHGEMGFILNLLSYKHDVQDPYPSRNTLATNLDCTVRQIDKWVRSLKEKKLLKTGRRRNAVSKKWDNTVYSLKPLIDELLEVVGKNNEVTLDDYEIEWDEEPTVPQVQYPCVPQVQYPCVPQVPKPSVPQVHTKKNLLKKEEEEYIYLYPQYQNLIDHMQKKNKKLKVIELVYLDMLKENDVDPDIAFNMIKGLDLRKFNVESLRIAMTKLITRLRSAADIKNIAGWFATTLKSEDFKLKQETKLNAEIEKTNQKYGIKEKTLLESHPAEL